MKKLTMKLGVLMLVAMLVGAACSKSTPTTSTKSSPTPSEESSGEEGGTMTIGSDSANDHGTKDFSGQDEAKVEADSFYFEPTVVQGTAGQQITLEIDNESDTLHNFTLTDQSIDEDIQAGEDAKIQVTIPQSGFVEFFCKYHKSSGMVGELATA
jgi:plastocyanin